MEMQGYNQANGVNGGSAINIAITGLSFPKNFYCWNTRDRRGIVIGVNSLLTLFGKDPKLDQKIIRRIVQRMLLYSLNITGLKAHDATLSCLFDLTASLTDLQFSVDKTFVCDECKQAIAHEKGVAFLDAVTAWVEGL